MSNKEWKLHLTEREVLVEAFDKNEEQFVDSKWPGFDVNDSGQQSLSEQQNFQFKNVKRTHSLNFKNSSLLFKVLPTNFSQVAQKAKAPNLSQKNIQFDESVNLLRSPISTSNIGGNHINEIFS
jgi:hypothetical protein